MALPFILGLGAGLYGLDALGRYARGGLLDKAIGSEGWEQAGPFRPEEQTMGMMGEIRNPQAGARGLLADPYNPVEQAKAKAMLASSPLFSSRTADSIIDPLATQQQDPTTLQRQFEYYQSLPADQQQSLLDYRRSGAQNINLGGGAGAVLTKAQKQAMGLPPDGTYVNDKNGIPRQITSAQFTQPQILAGGFATRMATSSGEIDDIYQNYPEFNAAGFMQNLEELTPIPSAIANFVKSPEGQRYRQAQDNWISANLRKESGAAIPESELENERRKWFPMPGDSDAVIAQKTRARRDAELSMIKASGGAFQDLEDQSDMEELQRLRMEQQ